MIKIKYGFIARLGYAQLPKAPVIDEGKRYPEIFCIELSRADDFCRRINDATPTDDTSIRFAHDCAKEILFGKNKWDAIVNSFDGYEPEIDLLDYRTPENLRVKLRVMLDENGKQVKEADLIQQTKTTRDIIVERIGNQAEEWKESQREKFKDIDGWRKIESSKRVQMIMRLLGKYHDELVQKKFEYRNRLDIMTDEQIEKEYRMEFGE